MSWNLCRPGGNSFPSGQRVRVSIGALCLRVSGASVLEGFAGEDLGLGFKPQGAGQVHG